MKKWLLLSAVLVLSACQSQGKKYYQLPTVHNDNSVAMTAPQSNHSRQLFVEYVDVSDVLSSPGIVYQTNDVQFVTAGNNLWASSLQQQLRQALVSNLNATMPGWMVSSHSMGHDQDVLNVTVTGFHGRYDGKVVISGQWVLKRNGVVTQRSFNRVLPQAGDGYDALVKTLAQGWQKEASDIARQIY